MSFLLKTLGVIGLLMAVAFLILAMHRGFSRDESGLVGGIAGGLVGGAICSLFCAALLDRLDLIARKLDALQNLRKDEEMLSDDVRDILKGG